MACCLDSWLTVMQNLLLGIALMLLCIKLFWGVLLGL
jgi:hypothetical protein